MLVADDEALARLHLLNDAAAEREALERALPSLGITLKPIREPSGQFVCFAPSVHSPSMVLDSEHALFGVARQLGCVEPLYERMVALVRGGFSKEIGAFVAAGRMKRRSPMDPAAEALWARVARATAPRA